jgi:hypothetical protein
LRDDGFAAASRGTLLNSALFIDNSVRERPDRGAERFFSAVAANAVVSSMLHDGLSLAEDAVGLRETKRRDPIGLPASLSRTSLAQRTANAS